MGEKWLRLQKIHQPQEDRNACQQEMAGLPISYHPRKKTPNKNGAENPMFSLQDPGAAADVASAAAGVCRDSGDVEGEAGTVLMEWNGLEIWKVKLGSLHGTHFVGIKCMVILRDFPYNFFVLLRLVI